MIFIFILIGFSYLLGGSFFILKIIEKVLFISDLFVNCVKIK